MVLLGVLILFPATVWGQNLVTKERNIAKTVGELRLGYVRTGVEKIDRISLLGLRGLSQMLTRRTTVEPVEPAMIDPLRDEFLFYPMVYWPLTDQPVRLDEKARARLQSYIKTGGIILFDTRDRKSAFFYEGTGQTSPNMLVLREILAGINVPRLEPLPETHVLRRSFYLLRNLAGKWQGGVLWVEKRPKEIIDSSFGEEQAGQQEQTAEEIGHVSPILIGSHDWAAAWAVDRSGQPLFEPTPGGGAQREAAYRFGVNLVMYALTGTYKSDQIHEKAIQQRIDRQ